MPYQFTPGVADRAGPLLYDSPHSGREYPPEWQTRLSRIELRRGEDAYMDEMLGHAAQFGVGLLAARYPRCFIDLNRAEDDIDPGLLAEPWPTPLHPTEKSRRGLGLVRRFVGPGQEVNVAPLTVAEVKRRIESIYQPYHARLAAELDRLRGEHGRVWMVDWHSMKSVGNAMTPDGAGAARADFVVSDLDGTSATPRFTDLAVATLQQLGYRVTVNTPYKGGNITKRYGRPHAGQHVIQIEINRALYLDEREVQKTDGFGMVAQHVARLTEALAMAAAAE